MARSRAIFLTLLVSLAALPIATASELKRPSHLDDPGPQMPCRRPASDHSRDQNKGAPTQAASPPIEKAIRWHHIVDINEQMDWLARFHKLADRLLQQRIKVLGVEKVKRDLLEIYNRVDHVNYATRTILTLAEYFKENFFVVGDDAPPLPQTCDRCMQIRSKDIQFIDDLFQGPFRTKNILFTVKEDTELGKKTRAEVEEFNYQNCIEKRNGQLTYKDFFRSKLEPAVEFTHGKESLTDYLWREGTPWD